MSTIPKLRCAVYTRKSTEEGLDQAFNSLDAQWEACSAFIASQSGLGWTLVPEHYDDGGISGGTMERPALQRLLQDIEDRKIDVVVVYKIDRLTRSLTDFSRIVEIFDKQSVSFVSVTQQFNTTTSMGRLTLNVLLSFAQFEREVTAERIRDKIAASKKKGMWMGGVVPLGYQVQGRKLIVDEEEAQTVRYLFERYLHLRSIRGLVDECGRVKPFRSERRGTLGSPFGRGNLSHLLTNPIYIGKIRHKTNTYDGEHVPIIDPDLFAQVQQCLADQRSKRFSSTNQHYPHLLTGIVFDDIGDKLITFYASPRGKRYRYYGSSRLKRPKEKDDSAWRIPAPELDRIAISQFKHLLTDKARLARWLEADGNEQQIGKGIAMAEKILDADKPSGTENQLPDTLRKVFKRIDLGSNAITFTWDRRALIDALMGRVKKKGQDSSEDADCLETLVLPIAMKRRGVEFRMVVTNGDAPDRRPDPSLVQLIAKAHCYLASLTDGSGRSLTDVARRYQTELSEVSRILPLAFLAPSITEAILTGRQPASLTTQRLLRMSDLPLMWDEQIDRVA